jgi:hypothetical protein
MELDDLKEKWAQNNRKLEASMRLNTALLAQMNLGKTESSLKRLSMGVWLEQVLTLFVIVLLGSFAADHIHEPRFFIPALMLGVYAIILFVARVRELLDIANVDYAEPVITIQKRLEELRLRRVRTTIARLLLGPLMWLPVLIVVLRGFFGIDVYAAASLSWFVGNLLFGLAVIPIAILLARRYGYLFKRSSLFRSLADDIAGRSLAAALDSLDTLRRFEEDPA